MQVGGLVVVPGGGHGMSGGGEGKVRAGEKGFEEVGLGDGKSGGSCADVEGPRRRLRVGRYRVCRQIGHSGGGKLG